MLWAKLTSSIQYGTARTCGEREEEVEVEIQQSELATKKRKAAFIEWIINNILYVLEEGVPMIR